MICHPYRCVFVHVPKTAGISIEHVFLDLMGLTCETRAPLLLRHNDDPAKGPPRLAHLKATEYVSCGYLSPEQFEGYFKFSFVRNPWDRIISEYKYRGYPIRLDFKTYLFKHLPKPGFTDTYCHILPQYDFLFDERGTLLVDFVGRYESLQADFDTVCARLGISPRPLPHVNRSEDVRRPVRTLNDVKKLLRAPALEPGAEAHLSALHAVLRRRVPGVRGRVVPQGHRRVRLRVRRRPRDGRPEIGERPPELPRGAPRALGGDEAHPGAQVSGAHAPIHDALRVVGAARRVVHPAKPQRVLPRLAPVVMVDQSLRGSVPPG